MASMTFGSPIGCLGFVLNELKNNADSDVIEASPRLPDMP
jgi:hypothetical protein